MLGGRMSNNDEDEVEIELARLTEEVSRGGVKQPPQPQRLPTAPSGELVVPVPESDKEPVA